MADGTEIKLKIPRPTPNQAIPPHATKVFSGVLFDVYQWDQELFNGRHATFEKLRRSDGVVVIPVTEAGEILMARQEQPGKPPYRGFVGGQMESGETPLETAARELLEETGYEAREFRLLEAVQPHDKLDWAVYTLVARGCRRVAAQRLDGGEKIETYSCTFQECLDAVTVEGFPEYGIALLALREPERLRALLFVDDYIS
jgi:ADP-ribose pyrophosphatase